MRPFPALSPTNDDAPHRIELRPPDIEPYRAGNTGTAFVTRFVSGRPGPHAMVTAIVHGNEICGAIALDFLFRTGIRPIAGTLTLAFANVDAFARFDPDHPSRSRYLDEDLNRVWSASILDGPDESRELRRARQLRPAIDEADVLLDLHSMQQDAEPLLLAGPLAKGRRLAQAVGIPATVICDAGHAAGRRLRDYGPFGNGASPRNALLIECGQHWARRSATVAIDATLRFLLHFGIIDQTAAAPHLTAAAPTPQRVVEVTEAVTTTSDSFRFQAPYRGMEVIPWAGTVIAEDGARPIVTPYDDCVLVMPSRRPGRGETAVRFGRFIA